MFCPWEASTRSYRICAPVVRAMALPQQEDTFTVPTTISEHAQGVLRALGPAASRGKGSTEEDRKAKFEAMAAEASAEAREAYLERVERLNLGGVPVIRATPKGFEGSQQACSSSSGSGQSSAVTSRASKACCGLYIHGGGFTMMNPEVSMHGYAPVASFLGIQVVAVGYRLAPQHPYPAALEDCYAVYTALLRTHPPGSIVVWGESAGAALAVAMLLKAKAAGLPMPAALALVSPWVDVTPTGDTYATLAAVDPLLDPRALEQQARAYVPPGVDPRDPLVSPIYAPAASYSGDWPPTLITIGTRDLFLSCAVRLYRLLKEAAVQVELSGWEGCWHNFTLWLDAPEGMAAVNELAGFLGRHLQR